MSLTHVFAACSTGGLYKSPSKGATVDVSELVEVAWDTSCLDTELIDLYLYAPSLNSPVLHGWQKIDYALGSYNATLNANWWNYTSPISLEFTIAPHGQELFMITTPAGPLFNATYSGSTTTSTSASVVGAIEQVNNTPTESKSGPSKGGIAAAVIIPILFIVALVVAAYIRISRQRGQEKRKQFSEMVDKRRSTISADWKSLSGAGANAAIRSSMAMPGNRA